MKNFKYILVLLFTACSQVAFAQNDNKKTNTCTDAVARLSEGWKKDSVTSGGYRLEHYKLLLNCLADTLSASTLDEQFGNPAIKATSRKELQYQYYFFNTIYLKKQDTGAVIGIAFSFDIATNKLISLEEIRKIY